MPDSPSDFDDSADQRRRAVAWIVALTANIPPPASHRYARQQLARYQRGDITFAQLVVLLDTNVYQLLYRSRATYRPSEAQLREMLALARLHNSRKNITGLLLYSEGIFVQVIEGPEAEIRELYARIQCDSRHTQVETVSEGLLPRRQFAEWSMDFDLAEAPEVERVLGAIRTQHPLPALSVVNTRLQTLLQAFIG
ncbi:BLUF domain-containing protein [Hymenobacter artigasi]|uniref:BLUF domain-containing protein n=1 Tax=Hymenobacter artigasi TaxID=2719616 RepID=A0ABX1HGH8_9BACT|nr:BLUF domain-containing protein [Hymenobacter artigasi]NKI89356.1 hypothetical protein [Hymenobacter artigasi]